jgi:hypothetical protein
MFNLVIGILHYLGIIAGDSPFEELSRHSPYVDLEIYFALGTAIFSGVAFLIVSPLLYVQLTNLIQKTTTNERFAFQKHKGKKKGDLDSDTRSMLLVDDDAEPQMVNEQNSDLSDSEISVQAVHRRCCFKRSARVSWDKIPN